MSLLIKNSAAFRLQYSFTFFLVVVVVNVIYCQVIIVESELWYLLNLLYFVVFLLQSSSGMRNLVYLGASLIEIGVAQVLVISI